MSTGEGLSDIDGMEKRHLTVMLADIAGSTHLANTLDPEDVAAVTLEFQDIVSRAAHDFQGHVARVVGDSVLALFGWPQASETDAERAVRAAMQVHHALSKRQETVPLRCRIGIATGIVLIGNASTGNISLPNEVFGLTPNLAARLQGLADPTETMVSEGTFRLCSAYLEFEDRGPQQLPGVQEMQRAFCLSGEKLKQSKRPDRATFTGRAVELSDLLDNWAQVAQGAGRTLLVSGEAGIGKSRLLSEFRKAASAESEMVITCNPFHTETPFRPLVSLLEAWCAFGTADDLETQRAKLKQRFQSLINDELLETLVSVIAPNRSDALIANEGELRSRLAKIVIATLTDLCRQGPVLMVVEDLHWIDPSSLHLLRRLTRGIEALPVLCVATQRANEPFSPAIKAGATIALGPLAEPDAIALANEVADSRLAAEMIARIVAQSNGVPLFLEECAAHLAASPEGNQFPIPASIHDLLSQKLDESGSARNAAVQAAVIGRPLDVKLLAEVADCSESQALGAIRSLENQQILEPARHNEASGTPYWRFRHALVSETAYGSLTKDRRARLHRRVAEALSMRPEASREPEVLARHWQEAGMTEAAVKGWTDAARFHLRRHANDEGTRHALNGLTLIEQLSPGTRAKAELDIQFLIAAGERVRTGYGAAPSIRAFVRCFDLAEQLSDQVMFVRAGRGLFTAAMVQARYADAEKLGQRIIDGVDSSHGAMVGHYIRGSALSPRGMFRDAEAALTRATMAAHRHSDEQGKARDVAAIVQIDAMAALVDCFLGKGESALSRSAHAMEMAYALDQPLTIANAQQWQNEMMMQLDHPEYPAAAKAFQKVSMATGSPYYQAVAFAHLANIEIRHGDSRRGVTMLQQSWEGMNATGAFASGVLVNAELAKGLMKLGEIEQGLHAIAEAMRCIEAIGERSYEAEIYRIHAALIAANGGRQSQVIELLQRAVSVAQQQGARLFEWRAQQDLSAHAPAASGRAAELQAAGIVPDWWENTGP